MFLATTSNQSFWKKDERILFLGEWCKLYSQKHVWQNLQHDTLPYHWRNREKLHRDYLYCESVYEKLLQQLGGQLNQIHGVDYSSRYWRIIIGPWLFFFVSTLYDRYLSIRGAIDSGLVTNTWFPPFRLGQWVCTDYVTSLNMSNYDENYNLYVFNKITQKQKGFHFEIKSDPLPYEKVDQKKSFQPAVSLKDIAKKLLPLYSRLVPDRFNDIVFANSYLGVVDLVRLQLSLGQMPYPRIPQVSYGQSPSNFKIRNNLRSPSVDNEFESLLDDMLAGLIPKCYVEDYASINQNCLKVFSNAPKAIFTANFIFDEGLKFWMAFNVEKGAKLVATQHGGGYGSHRWSFFESHEIKISDRYFSWGWETKGLPNIVPMASGMLNYAKELIKPNPNGFIVWVTYSVPLYTRIHISDILGPEMPSYLHDQECFLRSVSAEVHDLLLLRLYMHEQGWSQLERWKNIDPTLNCYRGNQTLHQQLNKSRLCITTTNSTVVLETFAANFPTILFWDPKVREVRMSAQPYFEGLRQAGILHDTPESAAEKVNEVYEDPLSWWSSPEVQVAKDKFCQQFAHTSDKWLSQWKEELLKIADINENGK
jgi:putative transferase (TIGR04331 family)